MAVARRKKRFAEAVEIPVGENVNYEKKFMTKYQAGVAGSIPVRALKAIAY